MAYFQEILSKNWNSEQGAEEDKGQSGHGGILIVLLEKNSSIGKKHIRNQKKSCPE